MIKRNGSYHTTVYLGKDSSGKRIYKSITADTLAEAKRLAAQEKYLKTHTDARRIDFKTAMDNLLDSKSKVLSTNTMIGYRSLVKNLSVLYDVDVLKFSQMDMQIFINEYSKDHSPKSCRNAYSFLMTVIKSVRPDALFRVKLPQKVRYDCNIPTENDIKVLLSAADPETKKAIMLIAYAPLRCGEALALRFGDFKGNVAHIHATISKDGTYKNTPKTSAGDRYVAYPEIITKELGKGENDEFIIKIGADCLYDRFRALCRKCNLPHFSLHSLRKFGASWLHSLGYTTAFIMERGGWDSQETLIEVYRKNIVPDGKLMEQITASIK